MSPFSKGDLNVDSYLRISYKVRSLDDANNRWAEATCTMTGDGTLSCIWKSGDIVATAAFKKEP